MATATLDELRIDRDRFVAFAFCDADILLELDRSQNIVFAAGATMALIGHPPDSRWVRNLAGTGRKSAWL